MREGAPRPWEGGSYVWNPGYTLVQLLARNSVCDVFYFFLCPVTLYVRYRVAERAQGLASSPSSPLSVWPWLLSLLELQFLPIYSGPYALSLFLLYVMAWGEDLIQEVGKALEKFLRSWGCVIRGHRALASKHLQRDPGSSAKRNTGFRKCGKIDMEKLGVLPRGSNELEAMRWVSG